MADEDDNKKSHHPRQAGKKREKKKAKNAEDGGAQDERGRNPRAFAIQSVNKAARQVSKLFSSF